MVWPLVVHFVLVLFLVAVMPNEWLQKNTRNGSSRRIGADFPISILVAT
jgi:hypothetical protein